MQQVGDSQRIVTDSATLVPDLEDLRAFCLVVDLGSVTAAARLVRESKATVSRRITRLESALGVSLVERTPRLVQATEDGIAYRQRIGDVLDMLSAANDAARHATVTPTGRLRVTSGPEFNAVLAPLVVAFSAKYPDVRVEMLVTQAAVDLDREGVDIALRVAMQLADSALIAHKVMGLDLIVVAAPSYAKRVRSPADLARQKIAFLRQSVPGGIPFRHRTTGQIANVTVTPDFVANDMNFLIEIAASSGAVTFVPELAVRRELASGALVRLLADYQVAGASLWLLHRAHRFLPPKVRAFRDFLLDAFRTKPRR